jgi:FixJ family two-component response regulator
MESNRSPLVAIVDDEASVCQALSRLLRSANFRAEAFASGSDFLESLSRRTPDCVVVDLQMPVMTGIELQQRLQLIERSPPVIVITAYDGHGTEERCAALGARRYLRKPIEADDLIESIRSIVGRQAAESD